VESISQAPDRQRKRQKERKTFIRKKSSETQTVIARFLFALSSYECRRPMEIVTFLFAGDKKQSW
jgi:hypothetical protein